MTILKPFPVVCATGGSHPGEHLRGHRQLCHHCQRHHQGLPWAGAQSSPGCQAGRWVQYRWCYNHNSTPYLHTVWLFYTLPPTWSICTRLFLSLLFTSPPLLCHMHHFLHFLHLSTFYELCVISHGSHSLSLIFEFGAVSYSRFK